MQVIFKRHTANRKLPKNLRESDLRLFNHEFTKIIPPTTCLELNNIYVLEDVIFDLKKFCFYFQYTHLQKPSAFKLLKKLLRLIFAKQKISHCVWITDTWSNNYFHWFTDALPRLIAMETFVDNQTNLIVILPKKIDHGFIRESLDIIGHQYYFYDTHRALFVKTLSIASHTAPTGNYNKNVINTIRRRFSHNQVSGSRRIYVSRGKAQTRKLINEDEVKEVLKSFDYETHHFEDYNLREQIAILSETRSLVGVHGAGLTNMLFMKEHGDVLEFRWKDDSRNNCYFSLASDLNHMYYYQLSENDMNSDCGNMLLNIEKLRETLALIKTNKE